MLRLAICDDEKYYVDLMKKYVMKYTEDQFKIDCFTNPLELLNCHKKHPFDVVILDINMPKMDGIELSVMIKKICIDTIINFATVEEQYVKIGYRYNIFRFIYKSSLEEDIKEMVTNLIEEMRGKNKIMEFTQKGKVLNLPAKDVLYVESRSNYLEIFTYTQSYKIRKTMVEFLDQFKDTFIQIARGISVNYYNIKEIDITKKQVVLMNNKILYITTKYKNIVKEKLAQQYLNQLK